MDLSLRLRRIVNFVLRRSLGHLKKRGKQRSQKKRKLTPKAPGPSKVSILTIPPGASIKLDGKELTEKTPHDVKPKAGEHQIEVTQRDTSPPSGL